MNMKRRNSLPTVCVVGLGNVLMGDDGFGPLAVEKLRCEYECGTNIEILDLGTPGLDLAPYLYGKDLVVIVDAVTAEGKPGTVRTYRESNFHNSRVPLRLTGHDPGLPEALAQIRLVGRGPSEVVVVGVIPESCVFGGGISSTVLAASSHAVDNIIQVLRERGFDCRKRRDPEPPNLWWLADGPSTYAQPARTVPAAHV